MSSVASVSHLISGDELLKLAGKSPKAVIKEYRELDSLQDIRDLFAESRLVALLYVFQEGESSVSGHWDALIYHPDGTIECFDSYNYLPDAPLDRLPDGRIRGQRKGVLSRLLLQHKQSGAGEVLYNEVAMQSRKRNVATCGRWCAFRLRFWRIPLEEFQGAIVDLKRQGVNLDQFITDWSNKVLKNG